MTEHLRSLGPGWPVIAAASSGARARAPNAARVARCGS